MNAHSIGTCWSSSMPSIRANGSVARTLFASSSGVKYSVVAMAGSYFFPLRGPLGPRIPSAFGVGLLRPGRVWRTVRLQ